MITILLIVRTPEPSSAAVLSSTPGTSDLTSVAPLPGSPAASTPAAGGGVAADDLPSTTAAAGAVEQATPEAPMESAPSSTGAGTGGSTTVPTDPDQLLPPNLEVGALPAGSPFAVAAEGTFRVVGGAGAQAGTSPTVVTYTVEIENGVTPAEGDQAFADFVDRTLADSRSWISVKQVSLQRVDAADAEPAFRITLASQQTVRGMCGFSVPLESSCYTRDEGRVVLNDSRWVRGSLTYGSDLTSYRQYAVNHEVGHALGYGHQPCGANGALAPVMMQQSWSTSNDALAGINGSTPADGRSCLPNPWPDPAGAEGQPTVPTD